MTAADLLWFAPAVLAVAVVLGASGPRADRDIPRAIRSRFVQLTLLLLGVAVAVRTLVVLFA